jgi:hypothetical protein
MKDYIIPEGMKLYKESCFVNVFSGWPKWDCTPIFVDVNYFDTQSIPNPPPITIEFVIGILFIFAAGILAATIIELLYNKLDWYLTPLVNRVVRRYNFTVQRNRLRSMNGHP